MNTLIRLMILVALVSLATAGETWSGKAAARDRRGTSELSTPEKSETGGVVPPSQSSANSRNAGERIDWQVVSSGGDDGASSSFRLSGTSGQTAAGPVRSTSFFIKQGFWQDFGGGGLICVPGDADGSSAVDIDDVVYLIQYIFSGGPPPTPEICCGDADGSGGPTPVDIDDAVYLIAYIFSGASAPVPGCWAPCARSHFPESPGSDNKSRKLLQENRLRWSTIPEISCDTEGYHLYLLQF
ncbi:MAG: dockerin type I repeat-containing protein [Candidatus Zixiibacteriota bacterium]